MTEIRKRLINEDVSILPLVTFRIIFGGLMCASLVRFWMRGWVDAVYIQPKFHFTYWGFEWIRPLPGLGMHLLMALVILSTLLIAAGLFYRIAILIFFIGFSYFELIDVTTYLNHYYFISLISFILIWLPANQYYSVDAYLRPQIMRNSCPAWCINLLKFQISIVYIFAGLAKLNADWLLHAQPLRIWLPAQSHLPVIGKYLYQPWIAFVFSWFGALYDLFIIFFLINRRTRWVAFSFVLIFHIATSIFFPGIGMFPYIMIAVSLIFFSERFHQKILTFFPRFNIPSQVLVSAYRFHYKKFLSICLGLYIVIQLSLPWRFIFYPGKLFWNEEGYRFSWRVMLMEKAGIAYFTVEENRSGKKFEVHNPDYLTPLQEKMMSTQPDLIIKYAHYLANIYKRKGIIDPIVRGEIYVTLNGTRSQLFADPEVDLAKESVGWKHYNWIMPFKR